MKLIVFGTGKLYGHIINYIIRGVRGVTPSVKLFSEEMSSL